MIKIFIFVLSFFLCAITQNSFAQEGSTSEGSTNNISAQVNDSDQTAQSLPIEKIPQVGKHVMTNMDASSMILSLLMVLALIFISATVLRRFNLTQQSSNQFKVIASLSLGTKEKVVVVQIGEQQLVLGVCPQQISLLKELKTPIDIQVGKPLALPGNVLSFLQKNSSKTKANANSDALINETTSDTTSNTINK